MSVTPNSSHNTSFAHGVIHILEQSGPIIPVGNQYGYLSYTGAINVAGASRAKPRQIAVKVSANTCRSNPLATNSQYSASWRLIKSEGSDVFTAYYEDEQPERVGPSKGAVKAVNKVNMQGFGIVVSREEMISQDTNDPILITQICHTDWDSQARKLVSFDIIYHTPKKGHLINSWWVLQLGGEVCLCGSIIDWHDEKNTWIVQTRNISPASGHCSRHYLHHQNLMMLDYIPSISPTTRSSPSVLYRVCHKRSVIKNDIIKPSSTEVTNTGESSHQLLIPGGDESEQVEHVKREEDDEDKTF